jgi:hypothetical protein
MLERCPPDVEGEVQPDPRRFDKTYDLGDELLEIGVTADQLRPRKFVLQIAHKGVRFVAERYGADTVIARGNQDRTQ